jgi:hypothetical protein
VCNSSLGCKGLLVGAIVAVMPLVSDSGCIDGCVGFSGDIRDLGGRGGYSGSG